MKPIVFCTERSVGENIQQPITIDLDKNCHILVVGGSGSGKSVASMLLTAKISLHIKNSRIWILDFKGDSDTFDFLDGVTDSRYWRYADCMKGLEDYYTTFQERLSHDLGPCANLNLLWADEWASFILNLPKKEAETAKSMLSTVLMMGRSKRCQVLTSVQRASAELFSQGARDNYGVCLALGNISKESASMLGFDRELFNPVTSVGGGHLLLNSTDQRAVQVPYIGPRGMARMKEDILRAITR